MLGTLFGLLFGRRRTQLGETRIEHEVKAFRHSRELQVSCTEMGLKALEEAQTALVHAEESGNYTLTNRARKRRDEVRQRLKRCMRG